MVYVQNSRDGSTYVPGSLFSASGCLVIGSPSLPSIIRGTSAGNKIANLVDCLFMYIISHPVLLSLGHYIFAKRLCHSK